MSVYSDLEDALVGSVTASTRAAVDDYTAKVIAEAQSEQAAQLQAALATAVKLQDNLDALQAQYVSVQDALAAETAKYDAYVASHPDPTPPPPPVQSMRFSISVQGFTRDPSIVWDYVRTYSAADLKAKNKGSVPIHSFTDILGSGGFKNWSSSAAKVAAVKAELATLDDVPGVMVTAVHEFDNDTKYGTDSATYLKDESAFAAIVHEVEQTRKNKFLIYRNPMEYSLFVGGARKDAVLACLASGDFQVLGVDCYCYNKTARYQAVVDLAHQLGKPYIVPELGVRTSGTQPTDTEAVDTMNTAITVMADAAALSWFDRKPLNTLDPNPTTAANSPTGVALPGKPNAWALWKSKL